MSRQPDPVLMRQKLGPRLRALRDEAGLSMAEAAERVGRDHTWMSKVERGGAKINPAEVEVLLGLYRAKPGQVADLVALARAAGGVRQAGMYREFSDVIGPDFGPLLRLEAAAESIFEWNPQVVPALLQIPDYVRAVIGAWRTDDPDELERHVALRVRRQSILTGTTRPRLTCVISEAVTRQQFGGREVMREQMSHLAEIVEGDLATVHVLPFDVTYAATNGAFVLCSLPPLEAFPSDGPDVVAYQDGLHGCVYHRDRGPVGDFEELRDDLLDKALDREASLDLLHKMARE